MSDFLTSIGNVASAATGALGPLSDILALGGGNWRARLRRASFRGAPFFVDDANYIAGRRLVQHEFPARDVPYSEDLGRRQKTWTFSAYLIGDGYSIDAERLRKACDQPKAGTLIHPTIGSVQVTCETATFSEKRTQGAYVSVSLTFYEAGVLDQPAPADTTSKVQDAAAKATDASSSSFSSLFSVAGVQQFVNSSAVANITGFASQISSLRIPGLGDQSSLTSAISALSTGAPVLIQDAGKLVSATQNVFSAWTDTTPTAETGFSGMLGTALAYGKQAVSSVTGLFGGGGTYAIPGPQYSLLPSTSITADRLAEARNTEAWNALVRNFALVEIGYNVPGLSVGSADDAQVVRDQIEDAFENSLMITADRGQDDVFTSLLDLKNSLLDDLDLRITQLPALIGYKTPRPLNALLLSWTLYGDANRDLELVDRTDTRTPAFMPTQGRVLEA